MSDQRERLLARRLPPTPVVIRMAFTPEADAAHRAHEAALRALLTAEARGTDLADLQRQSDEARAALDPFVEVLHVHALPPERYEQLIGEHPPTEKQQTAGAQWNSATFVPALLAECVALDGDERMPAADWADWMIAPGGLALGELNALFETCLVSNDRSPNVYVGKGSGASRS